MALKTVYRWNLFILQCASLLYTCSAISLQPCVNGTFDKDEKTTTLNITCNSGENATDVQWTFERNGTSYYNVSCNSTTKMCTPFVTGYPFSINLTMPTSNVSEMHLSVSGTYYNYSSYERRIITCSEIHGNGSRDSCSANIIHSPDNSSCSLNITTDTDPWKVSVRCNTSKMYSENGQYYCHLFESKPGNLSEVVNVPMKTTFLDGRYVNGFCQFSSQSVSADSHSYTVVIIPGNVSVTKNDWIMRKPSPRLTHSCPESVRKGSNFSCTCLSTDMGIPAGSLQWTDTNKEQLVKDYVGPNDNDKRFTCNLFWNGIVVESLIYTLKLSYSSEDLDDAKSEGIGVGIGIGIAVCVALAAIVVGIFLLWRQGWSLPSFSVPSVPACACCKMPCRNDLVPSVPACACCKMPCRNDLDPDASRVNTYDITQQNEPEKYDELSCVTTEVGLKSRSDPDGGISANPPKDSAYRREVPKTPVSGQRKQSHPNNDSAESACIRSTTNAQKSDSLPQSNVPKKESMSYVQDQRKDTRPQINELKKEALKPETEEMYESTDKDDVGENYEPLSHNTPDHNEETDEIYQNEDQPVYGNVEDEEEE